jgi:LCP family protein required for cell wall assembly
VSGHRFRLVVAGAIAALIVACGNSSPTPQTPVAQSASPVPSAELPVTLPVPSEPSASPSETPRPLGSFTLLVLGADSHGRTDAVMVVGVDIDKKVVRFASIPRDTIDLPLVDGRVFRNQKINAFWNAAAADHARYPEGPDRAMATAVGRLLQIRIDYYARTNFDGFSGLVDHVGGIPIVLPHAVSDDFIQVGPNHFGITFPKGRQTLDGKRALVFVRIRHSDNDFERQRRQQAFLNAAGLFALQHPAVVTGLIDGLGGRVSTDFPLDSIAAYSATMNGLAGGDISGVVLGPRTYERGASCSCGYALEPLLPEMRAEAARLFPWAVAG